MLFIDTSALAALSPAALDDAALMEAQRALAAARQAITAGEARVAAELARRSSRDLGYDGLAARHGLRSGSELVKQLSGVSRADAVKLVRVGTIVETSAAEEPWLAPALTLPVDSLDAVRGGLGAPSSAVSPDALASAARTLAGEAATLDAEALARRARELRAELDISSVALREAELFERRSVRHYRQADGMTKTVIVSEPEGAATLVGYLDARTAHRRGGPRFEPEETASSDVPDPRTPEQRRYDELMQVLTAGISAPTGTMAKSSRHPVRVHVAHSDLESGTGVGYLEGQSEPISIASVQRIACTAGVLPLLFTDGGQGMDVGRSERLHSFRQRTLIAGRDGECIVPGCDCPPALCEVHHIIPWSRGGRTSIEDGVLLCPFHHLMVHNNGWAVIRTGEDYALVPPASYDRDRVPIPVPRGNRALRRELNAVV